MLLTIALVVAIAVFCYAAYNLYHIYTEYRKGTNEYNSIEEMAVTERDPDSTEVAGPDAQPKPPIDVDFEKMIEKLCALENKMLSLVDESYLPQAQRDELKTLIRDRVAILL